MNELLNEAEGINLTIDKIISQGARQYESIANDYNDYKEDRKRELINKSRSDLAKRIKNQLESLSNQTEDLADKNLLDVEKSVHSMRSSALRKDERNIAESQFRSALSLLNTKNEVVILNELKKSSLNSERNEFSFTILENIGNYGLSDKAIDQAIQIMKKNDMINFYLDFLRTQKEIEAIQDKISYHTKYLDAGTVNTNYRFNKELRNEFAK